MQLLIEADNGNEPTEMTTVAFIKHFKIPKEKFMELVEEDEKISTSMGLNLSTEDYELPNADIIYTFDNDIINYYYRRE
jgi:hypothetical protein